MVDSKDILEKSNLLLKWAWPFLQGNTVANVPRIYGNLFAGMRYHLYQWKSFNIPLLQTRIIQAVPDSSVLC